jgi:hypothetical protein
MQKIFKLCFLFVLTFSSEVLFSFPDKVVWGYTCSACHVSPTGGGVLNEYGRMSARELLSFSGYDSEINYGLEKLPEYLSVGGDTRYVNISSEAFNYKYHHKFLMQSDLEVAINPLPGLSVVSSVGVYGLDFGAAKTSKPNFYEQRRSYVSISPNKYFSLRAGRFFPSYGLHFPDHSLPVRRRLGFDQGEESLNIEAYLHSSWGEVFLTGVNGKDGEISSTAQDGYKYKMTPGGGSGFTATLRTTKFFQSMFGASVQRLLFREAKKIRTSYGGYFITSLKESLYTLAEVDELFVTGERQRTIWTVRQGLEFIKGAHLTATFEGVSGLSRVWRWGLSLYPRVHFEFSGEYQWKLEEGIRSDCYLFLFHYYI